MASAVSMRDRLNLDQNRMYRVIECLTQDHAFGLVAVAALVCIVGSCLSVLLNRRLIKTTGRRRQIQLFVTAIIAGATIWSTHFIAMLAFDPGVEHAYEPRKTIMSLLLATVGMFLANYMLAQKQGRYGYLFSGAIFGATVSAMHYLGMSAYLVPGRLLWDLPMIASSMVLGGALAAAAHHRIANPVTRYCWLGGAILMVCAICTMHFTGMAAFEIQLDGTIAVPPQVISDEVMAVLIISVTLVILLIGFASFGIETDLQRQSNIQMQYLSEHDGLTGLHNRMYLDEKFAELQPKLNHDPLERVAVTLINLNFFKEINDLYGHAVGDEVLITVGTRMSDVLQKDEILTRLGGDEFAVIKRGYRNKEDVLAFAERLHGVIVEPMTLGDASLTVGASIGVALSTNDGPDIRALLQKSELAMQRAKTEPETPICAFDTDMDAQNRDRVLMARDLRDAIANDELSLVYQFQNTIATQAIVGFEALLRWHHPERGHVSPGEFIPIAEETGQIREIGLWVLRTACAEAATWDMPYSIAVNVAPQQLVQASFIENVLDILMETGLSASQLELEITEASFIHDQTRTFDVMRRLQSMGIRIAMDDFGTGYSSLAMLQAFPFNKIKIDKSFVQDLHKDKKRAAIVKATLLLAKAFDIPVLAEGVEYEEELAFLSEIKCDTAQGFYFGKPMQLPELRSAIAIDAVNAPVARIC